MASPLREIVTETELREELSRDLTDKERRVANVEQSLRAMDGVQQGIDEVRRETGALKAIADLLSQKTGALEAQREAVDRALAQAEHLDRAMRQVDAGIRQQQENEKSLGALQDRVAAVRALHETVIERSNAISHSGAAKPPAALADAATAAAAIRTASMPRAPPPTGCGCARSPRRSARRAA